MNSIKIEAFFIKKIQKFKSYELNLFKNVKIHLIFNISLLKLVDLNTFIQETFRYEKQKKKFKIEKILTKKKSIFDQMKKIREHEKYLRIAQEFCELLIIFAKISMKAKKSSSHCIVLTLKFFISN